MALSACGGSSSNNEKISGDTSGIDDGTGSISGALTVTGDDTFIPVTSAAEDFGTFSIDETGVWEYIAEASNPNVLELGEGETATEEVTVTTADGETQIITVTVVGVDDAPVIGTGDGVDTATLASDSSDTVTGTLTIADPDKNQSVFIPQTDTAGTYGTFSITTEGVWTYTLAPTASIAAVSTAATSNDDTFIVTSADGTEHDVVITVTASDNATPTLSECTGTSSLTIISATDDGTFDKTSAPAGTIDGLTDTDAASRWSSDASDADKAITFDLGELSKVKQLELLWLKANERTTYYNIETSADNTDGSWISVLTDGESTLAADSSYSFEKVALTESEAETQ